MRNNGEGIASIIVNTKSIVSYKEYDKECDKLTIEILNKTIESMFNNVERGVKSINGNVITISK